MSYDIVSKEFISLAEAAKIRGVTPDYLRLLILEGKLKGIKFGRNWVTTSVWVEEYFSGRPLSLSLTHTHALKQLTIA